VVITTGVMPVFMVGAMAVNIRGALGFSEAQLGLAASMFYAVSALCAPLVGRRVELIGAGRAMARALFISAVALAGVAAARSWTQLALGLAVGGVGNATAQTSTNLVIARRVSGRRLGLAFGVKQSAGPTATLLGGLALPTVVLTLGWRWAFAGVAVACVVVAMLWRRSPAFKPSSVDRPSVADRPGTRTLVVLAVAAGLGTAPTNAMAAFYVESAVSGGMSIGAAGWFLTAGSVLGVLGRVGSGWLADRREGRHLTAVALMLIGGAGGLAGLASPPGIPFALATACAFLAGWGWLGLFNFAVVRRSMGAPAAATGVTTMGMMLGGVVGPALFGLLVVGWGYPTAWTGAATLQVLAAVAVVLGRRLLLRDMAIRGVSAG
jgi:MFS family permease